MRTTAVFKSGNSQAVRTALEAAGTTIGNNDQWIAAHAAALDVTLVSNNTREFERGAGLKLDNWT